jgi:Fur family ferric uptake transcriptional regulator
LVTITSTLAGVSNARVPRRRSTTQGVAVRAVLAEQDGFRSAQDIHAVLRAQGDQVGLSTVYRHLQTLTEQGVADAIYTPGGETTYRFCAETAAGHHHHVVCRVCGRAEEVQGPAIERWATEVAARHGYTDVEHTIEVFGVCPTCAQQR